jgi:hypothetical protein
VVDACHRVCRAWWRGGRGSASPLHAVVARHRCNLCVRWWRIPPPSGSCQAVPDPPAQGASNACRDDRSAVCNGRGSIADRPWPGLRLGGRSSASARRGGRCIPGAVPACTDGRCVIARLVGVRRCLTRRPGRAGNPVVRRWARCRVERRGGRCMPRVLPRRWRGGRGSASPLQGGTSHWRCDRYRPWVGATRHV